MAGADPMARDQQTNRSHGAAGTLGAAMALGLAAAVATGAPAAAESAYGCHGLVVSDVLPSLEGADGQFFRIDPDLLMGHTISDESLSQVAALSRALERTGTRLVLLPMPTKALAMPEALPLDAARFGYDAELAASVYGETLRGLGEVGILAADARRALRQARLGGAETFHGADHRMTPAGARAVARAVAAQIAATGTYEALPKRSFTTGTGVAEPMPSTMARQLQRHCTMDLPPVETVRHHTGSTAAGSFPPGALLFDRVGSEGSIALVGTELSGEGLSHFAGFLAEATQLNVAQYTVAGGGPFAAISSYLTSPAFADARPDYLVWEVPVWESLARYGDQPMAELVAAATGACRASLAAVRGLTEHSVQASLAGLDVGRAHSVMIDTGGVPARSARFSFTRADGSVLIRSIYRHVDQRPTSRFYMPVAGLPEGGLRDVAVELDVPLGRTVQLFACTGEGES